MAGRARIRAIGRYRSVSGSFHFAGAEAMQYVRRAADTLRTLAKIKANHIAFFLNGKPVRLMLVSQKVPAVGRPYRVR